MPRYNVQHPKTTKWRCFSSIVDDWVTDWMDEDLYDQWRHKEYGQNYCPLSEANKCSLEEALYYIKLREENEMEE